MQRQDETRDEIRLGFIPLTAIEVWVDQADERRVWRHDHVEMLPPRQISRPIDRAGCCRIASQSDAEGRMDRLKLVAIPGEADKRDDLRIRPETPVEHDGGDGGCAWLRLAVARIEVVDRSDEMGGAFGGLNGMNGRHLEIIADDHDGRIVRKSRVCDDGVRDVHLGGFINEQDIEAGHKPLTAKPAELVRRPADNGDQVRMTQPVAHGAECGGVPAGDVRAEPFIHAAWCRRTGSQAGERHRIVPSLSRTYLGQFRRHIIDRHPCRTGDANPDAVTRTARLPDETGDARRSRLALARAGRPPPDRQRAVTACAMAARCRSVRRGCILASSCNTGAAGRAVASPAKRSASQRKRSAGTDGYCRGRREPRHPRHGGIWKERPCKRQGGRTDRFERWLQFLPREVVDRQRDRRPRTGADGRRN